MSHYLIGKFDVTDRPLLDDYVGKVMPLVEKYHGKVVVGGDVAQGLEGREPGWLIVIEYPTEADVLGFYNDPAYTPVKAMRLQATTDHFMVHAPGFGQ